MTKGLYNTAYKEEQAIWPENELKKQIKAGLFHSVLTYPNLTCSPTPEP